MTRPIGSIRVSGEIRGESKIFAEFGNHDRAAKGTENIHARQKIGVIELTFRQQILESHFHQDNDFVLGACRFVCTKAVRAPFNMSLVA